MLHNIAQRQQPESLSAKQDTQDTQETQEQPPRSLSSLPSISPSAPPTSSSSSSTVRVPRGTFVYASAPARIDLCGGWTDTIPIT